MKTIKKLVSFLSNRTVSYETLKSWPREKMNAYVLEKKGIQFDDTDPLLQLNLTTASQKLQRKTIDKQS